MRRQWDIWRQNGETQAAFILKYTTRETTISAALLVRFAEFCAANQFPTMKAAWQKFCRIGGSFGRGIRSGRQLKISYGQLCYHFPASRFYQMQSELKASAGAQINLAKLKLALIADLRARLPDKPKRRRNLDFQI